MGRKANGEPKAKGVHVRLSASERAALEARAASSGERKVSEVLRQALRAYLASDHSGEAKA